MQNYSWPGNILEFENVIELSVILANPGFSIDVTHLLSVSESLEANNLIILRDMDIQPQPVEPSIHANSKTPTQQRPNSHRPIGKIGRASCRERVCQYVYISVVAV